MPCLGFCQAGQRRPIIVVQLSMVSPEFLCLYQNQRPDPQSPLWTVNDLGEERATFIIDLEKVNNEDEKNIEEKGI